MTIKQVIQLLFEPYSPDIIDPHEYYKELQSQIAKGVRTLMPPPAPGHLVSRAWTEREEKAMDENRKVLQVIYEDAKRQNGSQP